MTDSPANIVSALQQRWTAAFNQRDIEGLVALYADESSLFGGKPELSVNPAGVRAYFSALPAAQVQAEFGEQTAVRLAPTVVTSAGFVTFTLVDGDAPSAPMFYRITFTLVDAGGEWKIASHHASPSPAS